MEIRRLSRSEWESALPDAGLEVFHLPEVLDVLASHTASDLLLLGGYENDCPVALHPLFVTSKTFGVSLLSSPPPGMNVPYIGPLLMPGRSENQTTEFLNRTFVREYLDHLDLDWRTFCFFACSPGYRDPRPFDWGGLSVGTSFTYQVPVAGTPESIMEQFSRGRRREIRRITELDLQHERGGLDAARQVYLRTKDRLQEQDEVVELDWPFVRDLVKVLGDRARIHVVRAPDGSFLGGIIALYSNDTGYFWLGGTRETYEGYSVNSLLHWEIIQEIAEDPALKSVNRYDMVGAGIPRLSKYKSTFGPKLQSYYVIKSEGLVHEMAEKMYGTLQQMRRG